MPIFRIVAYLLICPSIASAQRGSSTTAARDELEKKQSASVSGRVLQASTGAPLKKAWVLLRSAEGRGRFREQPFAATTREDGTFRITDVPAGRYRLSVTRNGYVRQEYGDKNLRGSGTTITLTPGQEIRELTFRLVPGGVISGRVLDEDGEPMQRISVQVLRYMYQDGEKRLIPMEMEQTDDRGEFRVFGLEPRRYYVAVTPREFGGMVMMESVMGAEAAPDEGYTQVYYPGTNDPASASSIEVRPGEEQRADFNLFRGRTYKISGHAIDGTTGEVVDQGFVNLMPRNSGAFMPMGGGMIAPGKEGKFEIRGVAPGSYTLQIIVRGDEPLSARQDVDLVDANLDNVQLTAVRGREVVGTLKIEGAADRKITDFTVHLQSTRGQRFMGGSSMGPVKADGSFSAKNLFDGEYIAGVSNLPPNAYLKSVRAGDGELIYTGINMGRLRAPLEIVVSMRGGRIEGGIKGVDSKALAGITVAAVPDKPARSRQGITRIASSDQYGHFSFTGLRPGVFKLYAWEEVERDEIDDPDFLRRFEGAATSVRVDEGGTHRVDLKPIPAGEATYAGAN